MAALRQNPDQRKRAPASGRNSPLFILVAVITTITALYVAKTILLPISMAILLTFLFTPLADRLERWRVPRIIAVLSIVMAVVAIFVGIGSIVTYQLVDISKQIKEHEGRLIKKIEDVRPDSQVWSKFTKTLSDLQNALVGEQPEGVATPPPAEVASKAVEVRVVELPESLLAQAQAWLGPLLAPTATIGLVIVLVLFLLLDRENQRSRIVQLFGRSHLHTTTEAIHDVAQRVGRYLRMLFLLNAGYGLAIAIGLWIIGVPGAVMWGVLGFTLRFLPYIGPWIAATLPIIVSIATADGWMQPMLVVGWYIIVELISNNVVEPLVYGSTTGVSTVGIIIAAIFWTWLWGPVGLILSVPMTVCLLVTARYVPQLAFLPILLADGQPTSPAERVYQRLLAFDDREPSKLAHKQLQESPLVTYYDEVLLPALVMAEQDRHENLLNDDQATFVIEATGDLIEDLGNTARREHQLRHAEAALGKKSESTIVEVPRVAAAHVVCIPLRDEADDLASQMLIQLLENEGFKTTDVPTEALTSEVVDQVARSEGDIVVVSVLPPIAPRASRLLCRRLRERYPELPIVIGFWTVKGDKQELSEPIEDAASRVVTTLAEAMSVVRSIAAQKKIAVAAVPPR